MNRLFTYFVVGAMILGVVVVAAVEVQRRKERRVDAGGQRVRIGHTVHAGELVVGVVTSTRSSGNTSPLTATSVEQG